MSPMRSNDKLKAPFPYFGGKSSIAGIVWEAIGDVPHYIEPFFGSGAVLLARPWFDATKHSETINDKDGYVANVWRSIQFSPDEVARWCDWPVNHLDLIARKAALIKNESRLLENLCADDKWHDPVMAGYWIWAASCWIGSGLTKPGAIPHIADGGMGVHAKGKIPHVGSGGRGVHAKGKIPHVGSGGRGVHAKGKIPHVGSGGRGDPYNENIYKWNRDLSERLRFVRVVCGDWSRVCGGNWQNNMGTVGIFFDPPYAVEDRYKDIYHHDSITVGKDVEKWCFDRGVLKDYRIVVAGYDDEYETLLASGWSSVRWSANGGYGGTGKGETVGKTNRHRETLFFSPHCIKSELF